MKRGFLNSFKANARPLGSPAPSAPTAAPSVGTAKFPIGKQNIVTGHKQFFIRKFSYVTGSQAKFSPRREVPKGYDRKLMAKERDQRLGSVPGMISLTRVPFVNAVDGEPTTECIFHAGSKEVLMGLPGFPQPMVNRVGKKSPIRLKEVPGMGLGLFATRGLKAGELIFSERPLLVAAQGVSPGGPDMPSTRTLTLEQQLQFDLDQLEKVLALVLERMCDEDKAAYMALKNSHPEDGSGPLTGIMRTNGLAVPGLRPEVTPGTAHAFCSGVRDMISRVNHSCSPNVRPHWNMLTFSFQVFATRDIAADEELTSQYIPFEGSTARRNELLKPYDFVCTCASCKDPESDARRSYLAESDAPMLSKWLFDDTPNANALLLDECRRQMELLEREGMEGASRCFQVAAAAFTVCVARGDAQNASEWARKIARIRWDDRVMPEIDSFVDPKSNAYEGHHMWQKKMDGGALDKDHRAKLAAVGVGSLPLED
ncbi:hypothetical protein FB45DRAFT_1021859 [Roridomyces roridus]|uniref:SET domain-containing protein n=1 Tax=Roridomyces roridus TaxID=1738132 RepID=A0AAD7C6V5_9AGAR|nr:hypothetical protein FB45DRAFT_1021859 [Roridomyces roridus]